MDDSTNHLNDIEKEISKKHEKVSSDPNLCRPLLDKNDMYDVIYGAAIHPEFRAKIIFPEYKKPSLKSGIKYKWIIYKHKIARLIIKLSNIIGGKNV